MRRAMSVKTRACPEALDAALRSRRLLLEALCFLAPVPVLETPVREFARYEH
jgi:hypothetical protein